MSTFLSLPTAFRDARRYFEVLSILVKYGFGDVLRELRLDNLLEKGMSIVGINVNSEPTARAVRLRRALEELGPTFIKLGQILSTRPDLIPSEWSTELKLLQDTCQPLPFEEIRTRLEVEYQGNYDKIFRSIDPEPIATASIAQVHRAVLKNGRHLLLKIVRPGIETTVEADLDILRTIAKVTEDHFSNLGFSPNEVVREFDREIRREIDLMHEAKATERLRNLFAEDKDIVFPKVFWRVTTSKILGVQEMKGTVLSRLKEGQISPQDRKKIVRNGARAIFRQCLEIGFFHADPHPGNIVALPKGRIAFIDCGMVGQIDRETMANLADLVSGVVRGDVDQVTKAVLTLSDAGPEAIEDRSIRLDVRDFISHFENTPLSRLDVASLLHELFEKLRAHKLKCPADIFLLIKSLTTIESIGKSLDPNFDVVRFAEPYIKNLVGRRYSFDALKARFEKSLLGYAELAESLPQDIGLLLKQFRRNRIGINLEHRGLARLTKTIEHASRNISFSLIVASMLVGSSILVLAERDSPHVGVSTIGIGGFGVACLLIVVRTISNYRKRG